MIHRLILIFLVYCPAAHLGAQDHFFLEDDENSNALNQIIAAFLEDPLDLNRASEEQLHSLPFIDDINIDSILVQQPRVTKTKLRKILGHEIYTLLKPLIRLKRPARVANLHARIRLSNMLADKDPDYPGSPGSFYGRVTYTASKQIRAGFLCQKDPGETRITDHISGFLEWNIMRFHSKLIMGAFQIHAGKGLVFSSPYGIKAGALSMAPLKQKKPAARAYLSTDEYSGFLGCYLERTFFFHTRTAVYISKKRLDATYDAATGEIQSINESGYHRTAREIAGINRLYETSYGVIFNFFDQAGFSLVWLKYSPPIAQHDGALRRRGYYKFNGTEQQAYSVFINTSWKNLYLGGESAWNNPHSSAHQYDIRADCNSWQVGLKWWYNSARFLSPFGRSFPNGKTFPDGRSGFYVGMEAEISESLTLDFYWLHHKDLWRGYSDPLPLAAKQAVLRLSWEPRHSLRIQFRGRIRKDENYRSDHRSTEIRSATQLRIQIEKDLEPKIKLKHRLEKVFSYSGTGTNIFQDIRIRFSRGLALSFRFSAYSTQSYASRIYEFENGPPGAFAVLPLQGRGNKFYILIDYSPLEQVRFWCKYRYQAKMDKEAEPAERDLSLQMSFRL